MEHNLFYCRYRETAGCAGCTRVGIRSKQPDVAAMRDLSPTRSKGAFAACIRSTPDVKKTVFRDEWRPRRLSEKYCV